MQEAVFIITYLFVLQEEEEVVLFFNNYNDNNKRRVKTCILTSLSATTTVVVVQLSVVKKGEGEVGGGNKEWKQSCVAFIIAIAFSFWHKHKTSTV